MQIRVNEWHLRVYLQAYVYDRSWLDIGRIDSTQCNAPEVEAFEAFEKQLIDLPEEERYSKETQDRREELSDAAHLAYIAWREDEKAKYTAAKSREVKERLDSGRMSLCPYFWSVVSALLFYYGIVRSTRPIRKFVSRIADGILVTVSLTLVAGVFIFIGQSIYSVRSEIPNPSDIVTGVSQLVQEHRQEQAIEHAEQVAEQSYNQRRAQEDAIWRQQHPDEALAEQQAQAQYDRLQRARNWQAFKDDMQELGIYVGCIALAGILLYLFGKGLCWLAKRFDWDAPAQPKPARSPSAFRLRFAKALEPVGRFIADTKGLILAMAKAKKEKVCPYLEIVTSNQQAH